jgi:cyclin L
MTQRCVSNLFPAALIDAKQDVAAACLYLTAKPSPHPIAPRQVLVVFEFLGSIRPEYSTALADIDPNFAKWSLSEGQFESARQRLYQFESSILRALGFETHVASPYTLCINYLQTLDLFKTLAGYTVAKRCFAHLNSALLSPQLLYLTHQPSAIVTAAIYLAAREVDVKLPETEWWEVFDVDREELGFLVVALRSIKGFAHEEKRQWGQRKVPLTVEALQSELEQRQTVETS